MCGQAMSFDEKMALVNKFIETAKPYEKKDGFSFDLRGYEKYIKDNNIPRNNVPMSVKEMFVKH